MTKIEKQSKVIEKIIKNNSGLGNLNNNNFVKSLKSRLSAGRELTPAQMKAMRKLDTVGLFEKAAKKASK